MGYLKSTKWYAYLRGTSAVSRTRNWYQFVEQIENTKHRSWCSQTTRFIKIFISDQGGGGRGVMCDECTEEFYTQKSHEVT